MGIVPTSVARPKVVLGEVMAWVVRRTPDFISSIDQAVGEDGGRHHDGVVYDIACRSTCSS